jgi:hypothetical protein
MRKLDEKETEKSMEEILEAIITENLLKLMSDPKSQVK